MASVDYLTDSELRSKLAEFGHPVGPVTETTRKILVKKLNVLMKAKNSAGSKNLAKYSSGEESEREQNGGGRNSRRVSMPPPTSFKSTKRKNRARFSTPSATPTNSSPVPSPPKFSSGHFSDRLASPGFSSTPNKPSTSAFLASTSFNFNDSDGSETEGSRSPSYYTGSSRSAWNARGQNHYRSDSGGSRNTRSGPTYETMSSYRARLSTANSSLDSQRSLSSDALDTTRDWSRRDNRLSSTLFGRRSTRNLGPQDIKESDAEDDSLDHSGVGLRKYHRSQPTGFLSQVSKQLSTWSVLERVRRWNTWPVLSMSFLVVFLLFFAWLMGVYMYKVNILPALTGASTKTNIYPICNPDNKDDHPRVNCILRQELQQAVKLYKDVDQGLHARAVRSYCGPLLEDGTLETPYMTEPQLIQFLMRNIQSPDIFKIETGLQNLKILLLSNPHWGIVLVKGGATADGEELIVNCQVAPSKLATPKDLSAGQELAFIIPCPSLSWYCHVTRFLYKLTYFVVVLGAVLLGVALVVGVVRYWTQARQQNTQKVMDLVDRILDHVSMKSEAFRASAEQQDFVALRHVHDTLIPPSERQAMSSIWQQAVKFIDDNESRIRTEVQQIYGEDTSVWRWLGPSLSTPPATPTTAQPSSYQHPQPESNLYPDLSEMKMESTRRDASRVWQGEAFETGEGSMNCMASSPTECLKIRHMFQPNKDYGPDWMVKVKDAIVEKCDSAKILHLSVDKDSKEGCVYVKCASQRDAGIAYRQLHGSWFDGALVTVRYLRLERYHERFPDSVNTRLALRPSNNLRLSLQGASAHGGPSGHNSFSNTH